MLLSFEELRGRPVVAADGHVIGELISLAVDAATWQVDTIRIKLRKDVAERVGAARGMFRAAFVDLPARQVQSVGDAVVLAVPVGELRVPQPAPGAEPAPQPSR